MELKKICCAVLCGVLLTTAAACGGRAPGDPDRVPVGTQGPTSDGVPETEAKTLPEDGAWTTLAAQITQTETSEAETTEADTTEAAAKEIRLADGLNSTDVEEVLTFYKLAAAKNQSPKYAKTLNLISLNGGDGKVADYVDIFEPIAKKAVSKNTTKGDVLPGDFKAIRPEDWQSAEAVSDGTYTTIRVKVKPQTDGPNGKANDGSVGRSMTVLPGVQTAIDEMPGVSADFANGDMTIEYLNPTITVKVDNRTGEFVPGSGSWSYRVHPVLKYLEAKVLAWTVHLINADGYIDYTVTN